MENTIVPTQQDNLLKAQLQKVIDYYKGLQTGLNLDPRVIHFDSENPGETVFVFLRRHPIENIKWIISNLFYSVVPLIVSILLHIIDLEIKINPASISLILLIYYSVILTNVIKNFYDWYFDIYIVTNERILSYELRPFSNYKVQEVSLLSVQRIQEKAGGIISNIFGYGNLVVSIEGPMETLNFNNIPSPTQFRDILSDLAKTAKQYNGTGVFN